MKVKITKEAVVENDDGVQEVFGPVGREFDVSKATAERLFNETAATAVNEKTTKRTKE